MKGATSALGIWLAAVAFSWPLPLGADEATRDAAYGSLAGPANLENPVTSAAAHDQPRASSLQLVLEGSSDQKTGTALFGLKTSDLHVGLKLAAPLDEASKVAEPASLDGLAGSTRAELGLALLRWPGPTREERAEIERMCRAVGRAPDDCDDTHFTSPEARKRFLELQRADDAPTALSLFARAGRNRFKYVDPLSLTPAALNHNDWAFGGSVGRYTARLGYLGARYEYQRAYEAAGPPVEVCSPLGSSGALKCVSAVLGSPRQRTRSIGRLEWRRFLSGAKVGFSSVVSRDFEGKVTSIELPVYFLQDPKTGGLTGGLRAGWRSDTDEISLAVFVGAGALSALD